MLHHVQIFLIMTSVPEEVKDELYTRKPVLAKASGMELAIRHWKVLNEFPVGTDSIPELRERTRSKWAREQSLGSIVLRYDEEGRERNTIGRKRSTIGRERSTNETNTWRRECTPD